MIEEQRQLFVTIREILFSPSRKNPNRITVRYSPAFKSANKNLVWEYTVFPPDFQRVKPLLSKLRPDTDYLITTQRAGRVWSWTGILFPEDFSSDKENADSLLLKAS